MTQEKHTPESVCKELLRKCPSIYARINGARRHRNDAAWAKEILGLIEDHAREALKNGGQS